MEQVRYETFKLKIIYESLVIIHLQLSVSENGLNTQILEQETEKKWGKSLIT